MRDAGKLATSMLSRLTNSTWAVFEYGWYPLLVFIATPWFLRQLGTELYGHWMLLTAIVGLGAVLNVGTGAATIKAVSARRGRSDNQGVERAVRVSLGLATVGGLAVALIVLATLYWGGGLLLHRMGDPSAIRLTAIVAAVLIWIEQWDNVFSSAIKGAEYFGAAARIEMTCKTLQVAIACLVLMRWQSLEALYISLVCVALARLSTKIHFTMHLLGIPLPTPSFKATSDVFHFAKWGWLQGVGGVFFGVADRLLVGALLGAASLAYYSIASQLAMQIHAISAAGLSVIFPKLSRKLEEGQVTTVWNVVKLTAAGNFLFSSALTLGLVLLGPAILRLWLKPETALPVIHILPWLAGAYWILALNVVPYYTLLGFGRIRAIGLTVLASGTISILTMYLAVTRLGFIGTPAGRACYAIASMILLVPLMQEFARHRKSQSLDRKHACNRGAEPSP